MSEEKHCIFGKETYCRKGQYLPDKKINSACPTCNMYRSRAQITGMVRSGRI